MAGPQLEGVKVPADNEGDAAYDMAARALAAEARGVAGDRTLTAEELEAREAERLVALEKDRLRRMRGDATSGDALEASAAPLEPTKGYAARRRRLQEAASTAASESEGSEGADGGDEEEAGEEDEDEDAEEEEETAQGREEALSADPESANGDANSEGSTGPGEEESEEGATSSGSGSQESEDNDDEPSAQPPRPTARIVLMPPEQPAGRDVVGAEPQRVAAQEGGGGGLQGPGSLHGPQDEPLDLPYTIRLPQSYEAFAQLVEGRPAPHLLLAIQRIYAFNAQAMAAESKRQAQVFYSMLVQHFVMLAGRAPLPAEHIDVLTAVLLRATGDVPFYAATVARARLQRLHDRLGVALAAARGLGDTGGDGKPPASAWPGGRALLQLRLFIALFPMSDRRHPVVTPLSLLVAKYLTQCVATTPSDVATGLHLAAMATTLAEAGGRYAPEPLNFLVDALAAALPETDAQGVGSVGGGALRVVSGVLRLPKGGPADGSWAGLLPQPPSLLRTLEGGPQAAALVDPPRLAGLLAAALAAAARAAQGAMTAAGAAAPAAVAPLLRVLRALGAGKCLPPALDNRRAELLASLEAQCATVERTRAPLVQTARVAAPPVREYNPVFEEQGFALGRDYDPDRVRAEQRKLKRQLQKEKRGAMRELRRDATFLAAHRDRERASVDAERMESQKRFYSELQAQAADLRSGGQKGMNPHLKKKGRK